MTIPRHPAVCHWLAGLLSLALPALAPAAQQGFTAALDGGGIEAYRETIRAIEESRGVYSPQALEPLRALARLHGERGEHLEASAAWEKALYIERVRHGLYSLEQLPLLDPLIESTLARAAWLEADRWQAYRLHLAQRGRPGASAAVLEALERWADWNVQAYYRGLPEPGLAPDDKAAQERRSPGTRLQVERVAGPDATSRYIDQRKGSLPPGAVSDALLLSLATGRHARLALHPRLRLAREGYRSILAALDAQAAEPGPERRRIAWKLADTAVIVRQGFDVMLAGAHPGSAYHQRLSALVQGNPVVVEGYELGLGVLEQNLRLSRRQSPVPVAQLARDQLALGDWHLLHDKPEQAGAAYGEARLWLADGGYGAAAIRQLVHPRPLVEIPAFAGHFHSRQLLGVADRPAPGFPTRLTLRVSLDAMGRARLLELPSAAVEAAPGLEDILAEYFAVVRFRPLPPEGESPGPAGFEISLYLRAAAAAAP